MTNEEIIKLYFRWLLNRVSRENDDFSCKLMWKLLTVEYKVGKCEFDFNRMNDGILLRERFLYDNPTLEEPIKLYLTGPCTMLEMLVALSIKAEDYTCGCSSELYFPGRWFFLMINNLGLANQMMDAWYDEEMVNEVLYRFMTNTYKKNGDGGLFRISSNMVDMRKYDIWRQFNIFLSHCQT